MEREANYIAVGAFVLLLLAFGAFFVIWYTGGSDGRDLRRYEIYFQGSISGLNEGSVVRYMGVDIGRVREIRLDPRAADRVQVIVDVDSRAPISDETIASLGLQGVTGLLYIDLERDRGDRPAMQRVPSERYPVIRSVQSEFDLLVSSMPELFTKAAIAADRITKLLSDENILAANRTIANVSRASDELPRLLASARDLAVELQGTAAELRAVAADTRPDLARTMQSVREVAADLAAISQDLKSFIADNQTNIGRFTDQGLAELQQLIRDGRQAAQEFRELTRSLKENPAQLIYEPKRTGMEIPR